MSDTTDETSGADPGGSRAAVTAPGPSIHTATTHSTKESGTPGHSRAMTLVASRRIRDAAILVVAVMTFVVTGFDVPVFEELALKRLDGETDYIGVTVAVARITTSVLALIGMLAAVLTTGAATAVVYRIASRAPREHVRPLGIAVGTLVAGTFLVRLVLVSVTGAGPVPSSAAGPQLTVAAAFAADGGLVVSVLGAALLTRRLMGATWLRAVLAAFVTAAMLAFFTNWSAFL